MARGLAGTVGHLCLILAMGMASIHISWGVLKTVNEWLPAQFLASGKGGALSSAARHRLSPAEIRRAIGLTPVLTVFLLAALLIVADKESFTEPMGFVGVLAIPIVSGVFSMLMLAAARGKGESLVGYGWRFLGNPIVVALFVAFFLSAIVVHGLVIWPDVE